MCYVLANYNMALNNVSPKINFEELEKDKVWLLYKIQYKIKNINNKF